MSQQLRFFRKNLIDLSESNTSIAITDAVATNTGENFVNLMLNRNNDSGWATTGSTDAATTTMVVTINEELDFDTIVLVGHNLKSFTLKYWNGSAWTDFSTAVNETTNTKDTNLFQFNNVTSAQIQLVINGTQTADEDKIIRQLIVTRKIESGAFEGWPILQKPSVDLSRKAIETISGKSKVTQRVGSYSVSLKFQTWPSDNDLTLLEALHFYHPKGFLFWPTGGDEDQFRYKRIGFRNKDIYLCGVISEWIPEWDSGVYVNGINMTVRLVEVI